MITAQIVDPEAIIEGATSTDMIQDAGLAAILLGLAVFLVFYAMFAPRKASSKIAQAAMLPDNPVATTGFDRYIRPMLRNFIPQSPLSAQQNTQKLDKTRELLVKSGNPWNIRAEEFLGIQTLFAAMGLALGVLLFVFEIVPVVPPVLMVLIAPIALFMVPYSYHNSLRIARGEEIQKQLPEAIDLIVITLAAGKTFEPALSEVAPSLPDGLLKEELTKINNELNAGKGLERSLLDFAARTSSEEAENFCKAIVQAQKLGSEPSETLENQARASREAYEARVEKKIARLSSIMMVPLVFTMIPALIIIILAPTMVTLLDSLG